MITGENIRAGIAAAKAGDKARAAVLLAQAVKADPASIEAWYWLGRSLDLPERRAYCFRRVLALDPTHLGARQELGLSTQKPAALTSQLNKPESIRASLPSLPPRAPVQPFIQELEAREHVDQPAVPQPVEKSPSGAAIASRPNASGIKPSNAMILFLVSLAAIFCIGMTAGVMLFSDRITLWLLPQTPTGPPLATLSANASTATSNPPASNQTLTAIPPTSLPSPLPTLSYAASFEDSECPFEIPDGAEVRCGFAIVPEDRSSDPSHTIRLAVAIFQSSSSKPAGYPVMFLQGGPGAQAVQLSADAYDLLVKPFLEEHDFIVFDQRGTGFSDPALNCAELNKVYLDDIHGLIPASTRKLVYSNAFISCNGLMTVQGIDLDAYTTVASAADVKDILAMLGYQQADLYGASYGTRLAQVLMRDHPQMVHSVILDSVVPLETNLFSQFQIGIDSSLSELFASCGADPACDRAYPQLESVFWELVNQLDSQPVTVTTSFPQTGTITESVDGSIFLNVILGSIKTTDLISTAPQSIYRFRNGDYSSIIAAQTSLPYAFEGISPGLYISMICHEHILATSLEQMPAIDEPMQAIRNYAWLPFYGEAQDIFKVCSTWGATSPRLGENDPVSSEIPTLIMSGSYDPATPPAYGRQLAGHLANSFYVEFRNQGHTPTAADHSGCAMQIATSFLTDPTVDPDRSCMDEIKPIEFITPYTGSPAYPLKTVETVGISVEVPRGWVSVEEGIWLRNNSPLDLAQVGIFQAPIKSSELEEYFASVAVGYLGLDSAPLEAGQREQNGLDWTLYIATSDGRPVDIAMAGYKGRSLVLSLISNYDERDPLYKTVFLPMIDSARP